MTNAVTSAVGRHRPRTLRIAALCLAAATVLSGCSRESGTALSVGSNEVSRDTVDTVVRAQCALIASSSQSGQAVQGQGRANLTQTIVDALLQSTMVSAYDARYDVKYDATPVRQAQAQLAAQTSKLPADQKQALTDAVAGVVRGQQISVSVGTKELQSKGTASPTAAQAAAAGAQVVRRWADGQGITVNPRYDVGAADKAGAGDGSISVPVTGFAKASVNAKPTTNFLAQLPPGQLCG